MYFPCIFHIFSICFPLLFQVQAQDGGDDGEGNEWTADHLKLLDMISRYAKVAETPEEQEGWVRKNQLLVLMYECIVAGVLDYDYAPCSHG